MKDTRMLSLVVIKTCYSGTSEVGCGIHSREKIPYHRATRLARLIAVRHMNSRDFRNLWRSAVARVFMETQQFATIRRKSFREYFNNVLAGVNLKQSHKARVTPYWKLSLTEQESTEHIPYHCQTLVARRYQHLEDCSLKKLTNMVQNTSKFLLVQRIWFSLSMQEGRQGMTRPLRAWAIQFSIKTLYHDKIIVLPKFANRSMKKSIAVLIIQYFRKILFLSKFTLEFRLVKYAVVKNWFLKKKFR